MCGQVDDLELLFMMVLEDCPWCCGGMTLDRLSFALPMRAMNGCRCLQWTIDIDFGLTRTCRKRLRRTFRVLVRIVPTMLLRSIMIHVCVREPYL